MNINELFEKFKNANLKIDLGDKVFSLQIKLEDKEQRPEIETKIDVQEKNIKQETEETPWRPLEIAEEDSISESVPVVVEEKPKEQAPKVFTGFKSEPKKPVFENETGWFRTERLYKGRPVVHYFVDGFTMCDDGQAKKSHMLTDKCVRISDDEASQDARCCSRCRAKLKDAKTVHGDLALPEGYTGWARKNGGGNHRSHFITCDGGYMSTPCKCESIDPKKWHQISEDDTCNQCETCREASKAHIKLTPENVLETFQKNTVLLKNPVPLTDKVPLASDDDVYFEAAKKCLERNRSSIIHEMRLQSSLQNKSIETMPVYFYTTEKVVKIDAHRDGLNKNANVSAVKMSISNREDGILENPAFDIYFLVQKQRKYMRRNKQ
jgi:hypothetical protein